MNIISNDKKIFSPEKLVEIFIKKCNMFFLGEQSDSQRFYRNLLTILEKEIGPNNTCIKDTFIGEFKFTMEYKCSNPLCRNEQIKTKIVQQPFSDIFLSVLDKESSIGDLLNLTYKIQTINTSKKCQCGSNLVLIRYSDILPNKYLSVNIQRGKISTRTLKDINIEIDNLNNCYEPYAINFHTGTMDYGHYYR